MVRLGDTGVCFPMFSLAFWWKKCGNVKVESYEKEGQNGERNLM